MSVVPVATHSSRVVAITGGARGIGLATARALRAYGARVAIGDLDGDHTAAVAGSIDATVLASALDVTDPESFRAFLERVERELGPLDVLVNNAGIMPIGPLLDESEQTARRQFEINVFGVLTGTKLALAAMLPRGKGHVINVASVAGKTPVAGAVTYAASKAAVVSLTESARVEFAGRGIHFSCVMPTFTNTELIAGTKGTRFLPTVQPEAVARAIVECVRSPRPDVYVPRSVGPMLRSEPLLGRRVRDAINRAIGADRTMLEIDANARASYAARIGTGTSPELPPGEQPQLPGGRPQLPS
jgi:NAD(P)-dependent dehydrogenase (short-subunit alcohol dehydrogenase family)